mgnify:CR=1 FL=1
MKRPMQKRFLTVAVALAVAAMAPVALAGPEEAKRWVETEFQPSVLSKDDQARFAKMTALNRWGEPKELVGTALLLASDAGSYITGATFVVDGGFTAR